MCTDQDVLSSCRIRCHLGLRWPSITSCLLPKAPKSLFFYIIDFIVLVRNFLGITSRGGGGGWKRWRRPEGIKSPQRIGEPGLRSFGGRGHSVHNARAPSHGENILSLCRLCKLEEELFLKEMFIELSQEELSGESSLLGGRRHADQMDGGVVGDSGTHSSTQQHP